MTSNPKQYLATCCDAYTKGGPTTLFYDAHDRVNQLRTQMYKCEQHVVSESGVALVLAKIIRQRQILDEIIRWLEDILIIFMEKKDLSVEYRARRLAFQLSERSIEIDVAGAFV